LYPNFSFHVVCKYGGARRGVIKTPHGKIQTPAFIFCATKAAFRTSTPQYAHQNNSQIILSNTYHLFLKGHELIRDLGGLHKTIGWNKPMLTDSGGYQIFAMNHTSVSADIKDSRGKHYKPTLLKMTEEDATFISYYDKTRKVLSPEISMQVQRNLGADIILVLDECTSSNISKDDTEASMHRSHKWEDRSLQNFLEHNDHTQSLYGIVQGGVYEDLRSQSCQYVNSRPFFGIAVGGCLGKTKNEMYHVVNYTMDKLRKDRPVHLLGIGHLKDIFNGVRNGVDTFDCVHPTRIARHGHALVKYSEENKEKENRENAIDLNKKNKYEKDLRIIQEGCKCTTCDAGITRAYLHMLIKSDERSYQYLITNHNIYFMNKLMEDIRDAIENKTLDKLEGEYCK